MGEVVDVHVHLYPDRDAARWSLATYEIAEYGEMEGVLFANASGLVEEAAQLCEAEGPLDHAVVVNLFAREIFYEQAATALDPGMEGRQRAEALRAIEAGLGQAIIEFNEWLVTSLADRPRLTPYVAVDPHILSPEANVSQLSAMADRGAKGVKLHPVLQRFQPGDPRMTTIFEACVEGGLTVLSHSGSNAGPEQYARPGAFAPVMRAHPRLRLVLAHLGGGAWGETASFAAEFPSVAFDLSEIIEWLGAPRAPGPEDFVRLIRAIGPEKVMLGSDYPWYDPALTLERLADLPGLSSLEKEAIAGENARRVLGL